MLISGVGFLWIQTTYFPDTIFKGYWVLPIFFFVVGIIYLYVLGKAVKTNRYMLMKTAKVICSLTLVLIYWLTNKEDIRNFAIMFIIYYFIFLIVESYFLLKAEKWMKAELERLENVLKQAKTNKEQQNIVNE
jgi:hypothetical protein